MKKKLQVFISSTYIDMIEERQAAVTAVLNAGHIPAGMELFKSGDQSQKETIKRWIDESDVYMLILGGRYGSLDPESGKSYTHWEYDYAGEQRKRRFAIVIKDNKLMEKARENPEFMEREHFREYVDFKNGVLGNISKFYEDIKDIKLIVMESLKEYESDENLTGWVKLDNIESIEATLLENAKLIKENAKLVRDYEKLNLKVTKSEEISGFEFKDLVSTLNEITVQIPKDIDKTETATSLLHFFVFESDTFSVGVTNSVRTNDYNIFIYYHVAPKLMQFGLLEKVKVAGAKYERIQTTKEGFKFLARYQIERRLELSN